MTKELWDSRIEAMPLGELRELQLKRLKKLFSLNHEDEERDHWPWIRNIFLLTVIITPLVITVFFSLLFVLNAIPTGWFAVIAINSFLPITSTNMLLVSYGIDKKTTILAVTWTTIVCVPLFVLSIFAFSMYL